MDIAGMVTSALEALPRRKGRSTLEDIDEALQSLHQQRGISFKKLKDAIHSAGICLYNGKAYGRGLPHFLRANKKMVVGREKAKRFKYVKQCLVEVF